MPDIILDQASGLTLVPVTFSQFPGLEVFLSTYHQATLSGLFYLLCLQVLGPHHLNMPHGSQRQWQWTPKNRFRQFSQISHCIEFLVSLPSGKKRIYREVNGLVVRGDRDSWYFSSRALVVLRVAFRKAIAM